MVITNIFLWSRRVRYNRVWLYVYVACCIQVALVICGLFMCDFAYMPLKLWHFRGTYPPIYQCYWSHYMRIRYIRANFLGPYLSHITRDPKVKAGCSKINIIINKIKKNVEVMKSLHNFFKLYIWYQMFHHIL